MRVLELLAEVNILLPEVIVKYLKSNFNDFFAIIRSVSVKNYDISLFLAPRCFSEPIASNDVTWIMLKRSYCISWPAWWPVLTWAELSWPDLILAFILYCKVQCAKRWTYRYWKLSLNSNVSIDARKLSMSRQKIAPCPFRGTCSHLRDGLKNFTPTLIAQLRLRHADAEH